MMITRISSILLASLIFVQSFNISLDDFSKFNTLISHAQCHQEMYGDDFLQVIIDHYINNDTHGEEHNEHHEDLPFKEKQLSNSIVLSIIVPPISLEKDILQKEIPDQSFWYLPSISLFEQPAIFQPPRI